MNKHFEITQSLIEWILRALLDAYPVRDFDNFESTFFEQLERTEIVNDHVAMDVDAGASERPGQLAQRQQSEAASPELRDGLQCSEATVVWLQNHRSQLLGTVLGAHKNATGGVQGDHGRHHRTVLRREVRPVLADGV